MKLPYSEPDLAGSERARKAKEIRDLATEVSRLAPQALTRTNGEEADHGPKYPANFTKGLKHDQCGVLANASDYRCFVEAINSPNPTDFDKAVPTAKSLEVEYHCKTKKTCDDEVKDLEWRAWESPRAGHVFELQGPDAGAVGMAPAPRVGSSELAAEMAEVYGLALLRDVPFTEICNGGNNKLCAGKKNAGKSEISAADFVKLLNQMPFYSCKKAKSSTPHLVDEKYGLNSFERQRRFARTLSHNGKVTTENVFRGSTKGAQAGPYISQFMLIGAISLACKGGGQSSFPGKDASFDLQDGFIPYGSLIIDQRTLTHKNCLDYMTNWASWLDVQNGANLKDTDKFEATRRFITTPRDLATYVHFDALYEAYLNACLVLLSLKTPASKGFPEPSAGGNRDPFATFGGPHILSLVCEVATRCLKAVRRQKFSYHRRARPEALGGRFTLLCLEKAKPKPKKKKDKELAKLGCAHKAFEHAVDELPEKLKHAIKKHNALQNADAMNSMRNIDCPDSNSEAAVFPIKGTTPDEFDDCNLLLPMAFPEGSPMHPAYGAGHATVAGGCITMLKAFFEMFEDCDGGVERILRDADKNPINFVPNADGSKLIKNTKSKEPLTIQGELDKLAANISIGRNMAGVHYYSDYFDSLRMGERIAIGILLEQAPTYGETIETTFKSFDGDMVTISGSSGSCPSLSIIDRDGSPVQPNDWWLRHVCGAEISEDL